MSEPAVDLKGVRKVFGSVTALDALDLQIERGEMFALVGPDGAGKTTLLRILAAVLRQDRGEVRVLGRELPRERRMLKRRIGYLSQGFSLYGDLSVEENLAFFAEIYGMREYAQRREELLEFTRLAEFRSRLAGRLSGGMKKKLALACALIHRPELIILDEPTTGVDPVSRRDFWVILGELLHEGLSIAVATPYLDEAERCGRVGLLERGRFLKIGRPEEIKGAIRGRIFEVVTGEPRRAQRSLSESGLPGLLEMQTKGDRLHLRIAQEGDTAAGSCPGAGTDALPSAAATGQNRSPEQRITDFFGRKGIPLSSVRESSPTLENLFISLITEEHL